MINPKAKILSVLLILAAKRNWFEGQDQTEKEVPEETEQNVPAVHGS